MMKSALSARTVRVCVLAVGLTSFVSLATQGQAQDDGDLVITVENGDTFSEIVSRELNSLDAWGEVAKHNKLESPDSLRPGDVIVIPAELLKRRNYGKVVFVKGAAIRQLAADSTNEVLVKGAKIYPGDMIKTEKDGFVSVSFNGGTSVNIQPESTMRINILDCIDKEKACEIYLESEKGQLSLDVQNKGFSSPTVFSIDSPYASAAVRGTKFDFDINEGNILGVTEGLVEISLNGISNNINMGKGVLGGQGRSINDVIDLLVEPTLRLTDDVNRVSAEDVISWDTVEGAAKYLVAYAKSETMADVVVSLSQDDNINKPDLTVGDYFVSARAVDTNGLRGFISKNAFSYVNIDEKVEASELDIVMSETEMRVTAGEGTGTMEVKVGNEIKIINKEDHVVGVSTHQLSAGQSISIPVDSSKKWYLQSRKIVNKSTVSPYGVIYFFDKKGG